MSKLLKDIIFGTAVGDALGVPVEFLSRDMLKANPVTGMREFGTHQQPKGTWSDDTAMSLCLLEQLLEDKGEELNHDALGQKFIMWMDHGYWAPHGNCFDIGNATRQALYRGQKKPELSACSWGGLDEGDNGNGSLMRILPLLSRIYDLPLGKRWIWTKDVSAITHGHIRSQIACFFLLEVAREIYLGNTKKESIFRAQGRTIRFFLDNDLSKREADAVARVLTENIWEWPEEKVYSSGYVIHTLEASLWCLATTSSYEECVLKAVNLGSDTDTTAAVAGGLAGILYGYEAIPSEWIACLSRLDDLIKITDHEI